MNQEVKALWLNALRSGEYKQGHFWLRRNNDKFCCLGVLCDLHAKAHGKEWDDRAYLGVESAPPQEVLEWAGLPKSNPHVMIPSEDKTLAALNDYHEYSFRQIADLIEAQL